MRANAASGHALTRFKKRSGIKRELRAASKLFNLADRSVPIGRDRFYSRGWIVVVKSGLVKTAYRPKTREEFDAIHSAKKKEKL